MLVLGFEARVAAGFGGALVLLAEPFDALLQALKAGPRGGVAHAETARDPRRVQHIERTLPDGRVYNCEVIDISISGAGIRTDILPAIGTFVMLGKMKGKVVRYLENGVAIEFMKQLEKSDFTQGAA